MRIVLLYPPPWKIPAAGRKPDTSGDGPPKEGGGGSTEGDFLIIPYGLLSLAAQAMHDGHQVKVFNLANFPWAKVESLLQRLDADVYGLTCFTSNRRGVDLVTRHLRKFHPDAHIVVGGPHVTALPRQTLQYYKAIDTVVIGEGETTFMELIHRLETGQPTPGLPGTAWRDGEEIRIGQLRERITDLDSLVPIHEYFPFYMILSARGCPGRCTFCASNTMWGKKVSFHSERYILDLLEKLLPQLPVKTLAFKDDTFTVNHSRAMRICRGIIDRGLNFLWSCDTRADSLDEELLRTMRLAGCQMISLGVESASPTILKNIGKNITTDKVLEVTSLARKYGILVRYYMMAGNRGETQATFQESLNFILAAAPHEFLFSVLAVYPGTEDFEFLTRRESYVSALPGNNGVAVQRRNQKFTAEDYFTEDFMERWVFPDASASDAMTISRLIVQQYSGIRKFWKESTDGHKAILERLPNLHVAHMDAGAAYAFAGQSDAAERHIYRAIELGYPLPALAHNYLSCLAAQRGDLKGLEDNLQRATQHEPCSLVKSNMKNFTNWMAGGGPDNKKPLELAMNHDFEASPTIRQPFTPTPLAENCCQWE